jgi:hypothetical protein
MKKVTTLLAILVLTLAAVPAFALNNLVTNGDFVGNLNGWTQDGIGHNVFNYSSSNGGVARSDTSYPFNESYQYQIINAANSTGWIANGISETINFSFKYAAPDATTAEAALYYYVGTGTPTTFNMDSPGSNWMKIYLNNNLTNKSSLFQVDVCETLCGQPQYFAIAFEGLSTRTGSHYPYTYNYVDFDCVSLTTQCSAVPVPPAVWLMGSGLVGLLGLRRRFSLNG